MTRSLEEVYRELALSKEALTPAHLERLEAWARAHGSTEGDLLHAVLILPLDYSSERQLQKEKMFEQLAERFPEWLSARTADGSTILHTMAENNYDRLIARFLPAHMALANVMNHQGHYPVVCAILNGGHASVEVFLKIPGTTTLIDAQKRVPLHYAARHGDAEMLAQVLAADRSVLNARDQLGETPLQYAHNEENAGILLAAGAE